MSTFPASLHQEAAKHICKNQVVESALRTYSYVRSYILIEKVMRLVS